jgi:hypothetical protein
LKKENPNLMRQSQVNIIHNHKNNMKNSKLPIILTAITISFLMSSCSAIAGIFKAGMGFGIFIVVLVIIIIVVIISRVNKK